ncbi:hypothetical protein BD289DRAFT_367205 [Coniella lustricola]|uniref:Chitinase n=1 Tax=Coniella lustricola TaxID=2025994 RepID=A0A2T3A9V3_9PEZI|nr:hypothetical protein BD289DRAFT_367205 [Coniella lustricola]
MADSPRSGGLPGPSLLHVVSLALIVLSLFTAGATSQQADNQKPIGAEDGQSARQQPALPVLGYVTPWNSRGKQLVEDYRHKFDIVSPVWYTIHAMGDGYEVRGAPPADEDAEWYKRLQQPAESTDGKTLQPVKVAPRFILDGWSEDDYRQFIFNETRWQLLSDVVMDVVQEMGYEGIVFESGATHALPGSLVKLSEALHSHSKILVLVMQPVRPVGDSFDELSEKRAALIQETNHMILQNLPYLAMIADYISIMTYDMTGPGGREISPDVIAGEGKIAEAVAKGNVREPGPNTSADWVRENLVNFVEASVEAGDAKLKQDWSLNLESQHVSSCKFLLGAPLYGYKYPVVYVHKALGRLVEPTPVDPLPDRPLITGAAAPKVRKKAPEGSMAILRERGEAITANEIIDLINANKPEAIRLEPEGEYYFDYEDKPGTGFWRVFIPAKDSLSNVLNTIKEVTEDDFINSLGGAGVALWEIGQSSEGLLQSL